MDDKYVGTENLLREKDVAVRVGQGKNAVDKAVDAMQPVTVYVSAIACTIVSRVTLFSVYCTRRATAISVVTFS